eukprot:852941-Rhodomonas_salina.1
MAPAQTCTERVRGVHRRVQQWTASTARVLSVCVGVHRRVQWTAASCCTSTAPRATVCSATSSRCGPLSPGRNALVFRTLRGSRTVAVGVAPGCEGIARGAQGGWETIGFAREGHAPVLDAVLSFMQAVLPFMEAMLPFMRGGADGGGGSWGTRCSTLRRRYTPRP